MRLPDLRQEDIGCSRRYSYRAVVPHLGAPTIKKIRFRSQDSYSRAHSCEWLVAAYRRVARKLSHSTGNGPTLGQNEGPRLDRPALRHGPHARPVAEAPQYICGVVQAARALRQLRGRPAHTHSRQQHRRFACDLAIVACPMQLSGSAGVCLRFDGSRAWPSAAPLGI